MEKIQYPDEFLDYLIDNVVIPYINKESCEDKQPGYGDDQASE